MHFIKALTAITTALWLTAGPLSALSLAEGAQPAEAPPSDYDGEIYVDSRGCVYIRAGFSGSVTWVPRVTRDRQVVCGQTPTFAAAPTAPEPETVAEPAPEPQMEVPAEPEAQTVAVVAAAPRPTAKPAPSPTPRTVSAPPPAARAAGTMPKGYRPAWTDDRLNPDRGPRSAAGDAQMNLIWTQTVPRRLIDPVSGRDVTRRFRGIEYPAVPSGSQVAAMRAGKIVIMTRSAPQPVVTASHRWVQVGTFGVAANAKAAARQLKRLGLPVRFAETTMGGKAVKIVLAGPFTAQADLNAALAQARGAGFTDAFLRR